MTNKKVPAIRFDGFTNAWEQRKLGSITESFSGGTPTAGKSDYYGGEIPFIRSGEISSDSTELFITDAGLNNSSAKMVEVGDILYALYGATSGVVSISRIKGAINQAILAIQPTKGDDSYMIVQWLKKQKETIISTYLQGGQGNLSGSIVKDLVITLPKDKDEQSKVGSFFKQLDDTIALHQRKLVALKEMKKGFLQKMFPKAGAKVPEVRFPGFTDAWELRKLRETAKEFKSGMNIKAEDIYKTGSFPVFGGNGIRGYTNTYNHDGEFALIGRQGALSGNMNYSIGKAYFTEHAIAVKASEENDTKFLFYLMYKLELGRWVTQSAQPGLAVGTILEIKHLLPIRDEQKKISQFFTVLDQTIALHQRQLDLLKETKKAFLQKMFV